VTVFLAESQEIHIPEQVPGQVPEQVPEQVIRLVHCLKDTPLSVKEAMKCIGLNHRPSFIYGYLKPAIDGGYVEMTQPDSPNSPRQKYRLTRKGKDILAIH
jgi:hypothetical protein